MGHVGIYDGHIWDMLQEPIWLPIMGYMWRKEVVQEMVKNESYSSLLAPAVYTRKQMEGSRLCVQVLLWIKQKHHEGCLPTLFHWQTKFKTDFQALKYSASLIFRLVTWGWLPVDTKDREKSLFTRSWHMCFFQFTWMHLGLCGALSSIQWLTYVVTGGLSQHMAVCGHSVCGHEVLSPVI